VAGGWFSLLLFLAAQFAALGHGPHTDGSSACAGCCGHAHERDSAPTEHDGDRAPSDPSSSDGCAICRLAAQAPTAPAMAPSLAAPKRLIERVLPAPQLIAPASTTSIALARGPPALPIA